MGVLSIAPLRDKIFSKIFSRIVSLRVRTLLKPDSEFLPISPQAFRRDLHRARAVDPADKPLRKTMRAKCGADDPARRAPLAPVETRPAQQASRLQPAALPHMAETSIPTAARNARPRAR